ncbi:MAG: CPBP family intramembrane glutamic endopeptidase [Acidimicrobiales bacterium]
MPTTEPPAGADRQTADATAPTRRQLGFEILLVLGVSYGIAGLTSALDLLRSATANAPLSKQVAFAFYQPADSRAWLDVSYQVLGLVGGLVPVFLVAYLLVRSADSLATVGVDGTRRADDVRWGIGLALAVGAVGLGFRLAANALGVNLRLSIGSTGHWWQLAILVAQSAVTALGEEVVVLAFVVHRLRQRGWSDTRAVVASAVVRGSYHLYQGFGGGVANALMGLVFGAVYIRRRRVVPLVLAHFLIDAVATIGYVELHSRWHWLH